MRIFRVILFAFAFAIFSAGGVARAEESPPAGSPVVAQAQAPALAHSGDDRPAMLGDIRDAETRINSRIDRLEVQMNARMDRTNGQIESLREDVRVIHNALYAVLFTLLAGVGGGLAMTVGILLKDRRKGMISGAAAMAFLLVVAGSVALASCEAAAAESYQREMGSFPNPPRRDLVNILPLANGDESHRVPLDACGENQPVSAPSMGIHIAAPAPQNLRFRRQVGKGEFARLRRRHPPQRPRRDGRRNALNVQAKTGKR